MVLLCEELSWIEPFRRGLMRVSVEQVGREVKLDLDDLYPTTSTLTVCRPAQHDSASRRTS